MPKKSTKAKEQRFKVGDRVIVVDPDSDACGLSGVIQEFNSEDPGECCVRFKNPREIFHDGELGSLYAKRGPDLHCYYLSVDSLKSTKPPRARKPKVWSYMYTTPGCDSKNILLNGKFWCHGEHTVRVVRELNRLEKLVHKLEGKA